MSKLQVLEILVKEAELVCCGSALPEGKLMLFRRAIQMKGFSEVARSLSSHSGQELFACLEQVQRMEENDDYDSCSDLMVQCCLILDFALNCTAITNVRQLMSQRTFVFGHCRTLAEIAHLRFRLKFVRPESCFLLFVEQNLIEAVKMSVQAYEPTWQGVLLVLQCAEPGFHWRLLQIFDRFLEAETFEIPTPAATLLLSFVSDAMRSYRCMRGERVAERLLNLGASPMISLEDHPALFEKVRERFFGGKSLPGWLQVERTRLRTSRGPTALKRLVSDSMSPALRIALEQRSCCQLDHPSACSQIFSSKMPSLKCIAARHIKEADLACLPAHIKFTAAKHLLLSKLDS